MKKILFIFFAISLQLSSCVDLGKFKNWAFFTKWESDDGDVTLFSYDVANAGFGQIKDTNIIDIYWTAASPSGSYIRLSINEKGQYCDCDFSTIMTLTYKRITGSKNKFNVYKINVTEVGQKYVDLNYWTDRTFVMSSCAIDDELIDARYFRSLLYNKDLNKYFYTDVNKMFESVYICNYNSTQFYLHFIENNIFVFKNETNETLSNGTYTTRKDGVDLYFVEDTIFDLQDKTMTLTFK